MRGAGMGRLVPRGRGVELHRLTWFVAIFIVIINVPITRSGSTSATTTTKPPLPSSSPPQRTSPPHTTMPFCRDRLGRFPRPLFNIHACAKCLEYLLPDGTGEFVVNSTLLPGGLAMLQKLSTGVVVFAEPGNQTAMRVVCDTLTRLDCDDWTVCCQASYDCCQRQDIAAQESSRGFGGDVTDGGNSDDTSGHCPMTWDGYSCVDNTPAGQTAVVKCPAFIKRFNSDISGSASRQCWLNASWYVNEVGLEWTNYETCHKIQDHGTILNLTLAFKGISLLLLAPAIAIFLMFRQLRSQLRIKIHVNLFLSLALTDLFSLLWVIIVNRSLLVDERPDDVITNHQTGCKFLNITYRYLMMTAFFWMLCEGFYLTWLMLQSFRHLSSIRGFCFFGWGVPVVFCLVYIVVRVTEADDELCWVVGAGGFEWLIDAPQFACIGLNVLFLLAIMRVMVRQLQSHNEQRSALRRSLRALLILVPLLGLQQFCLLYRPDHLQAGYFVYEVASAAIVGLQGAVVALIFCFFNGEVQGHLKDLYRRLQYKLRPRSRRSRQSLSLSSSVNPRPSRPSLASIDTIASVVLAPVHLSATTTATTTTATATVPNNGGVGGDENGAAGGGKGWRVRISGKHDSIAEGGSESECEKTTKFSEGSRGQVSCRNKDSVAVKRGSKSDCESRQASCFGQGLRVRIQGKKPDPISEGEFESESEETPSFRGEDNSASGSSSAVGFRGEGEGHTPIHRGTTNQDREVHDGTVNGSPLSSEKAAIRGFGPGYETDSAFKTENGSAGCIRSTEMSRFRTSVSTSSPSSVEVEGRGDSSPYYETDSACKAKDDATGSLPSGDAFQKKLETVSVCGENSENRINETTVPTSRKRFSFLAKALSITKSRRRSDDISEAERAGSKLDLGRKTSHNAEIPGRERQPDIIVSPASDDNYNISFTTPQPDNKSRGPSDEADSTITTAVLNSKGALGYDGTDGIAKKSVKTSFSFTNECFAEDGSVSSRSSSEDGLVVDNETLNLVHISKYDLSDPCVTSSHRAKPSHHHQLSKPDHLSLPDVIRTFNNDCKRRYDMTSAYDDTRRLCDANSLQSSDSSASFASSLLKEAESDQTSVADPEDSGTPTSKSQDINIDRNTPTTLYFDNPVFGGN